MWNTQTGPVRKQERKNLAVVDRMPSLPIPFSLLWRRWALPPQRPFLTLFLTMLRLPNPGKRRDPLLLWAPLFPSLTFLLPFSWPLPFVGMATTCFRGRASLSRPVLTGPPSRAGGSHLCGSALPVRLLNPHCTLNVSTSWRLWATPGPSNQKTPLVLIRELRCGPGEDGSSSFMGKEE